jgi:hypothetical protein
MQAIINNLLHGSVKNLSLPLEKNQLLLLGKEQHQGEAGEERIAGVLVPIQVPACRFEEEWSGGRGERLIHGCYL